VTDSSSKDSTNIPDDLDKPYGCYGLITTTGFMIWVDEYKKNNPTDPDPLLDGLMMVWDKSTDRMQLWDIKSLWPNEDGGIIT